MELIKNIGYVILMALILITPWWILIVFIVWAIQNRK
jgi:hypothetical protein